jgi:hypothetical protein
VAFTGFSFADPLGTYRSIVDGTTSILRAMHETQARLRNTTPPSHALRTANASAYTEHTTYLHGPAVGLCGTCRAALAFVLQLRVLIFSSSAAVYGNVPSDLVQRGRCNRAPAATVGTGAGTGTPSCCPTYAGADPRGLPQEPDEPVRRSVYTAAPTALARHSGWRGHNGDSG